MADAEARCRAQVAAGVWVQAHSARDVDGTIVARFQRYMGPSAPDAGAWATTDQDNVD